MGHWGEQPQQYWQGLKLPPDICKSLRVLQNGEMLPLRCFCTGNEPAQPPSTAMVGQLEGRVGLLLQRASIAAEFDPATINAACLMSEN